MDGHGQDLDSGKSEDLANEETKKQTKPPNSRFYLITYPRTASNLLVRILNLDNQPKVMGGTNHGGYFFLPATYVRREFYLQGRLELDKWTENDKKELMQSFQECFDSFERHLEKAEAEGKIVFVKEHTIFMMEPTARSRFLNGHVSEAPWTVKVPGRYGTPTSRSTLNETIMPDEFLQTWLPTFLIRHPALAFASDYRASLDIDPAVTAKTQASKIGLKVSRTLHWTRTLFDWYSQHLGKSDTEDSSTADGTVTWPLVLDADDIMMDPSVVTRFCEIVGLDSTKLKFEWQKATSKDLADLSDDLMRRMLSSLSASSGIRKDKTSLNLDIGVEGQKWREEFGEEEGAALEKAVRDAMPDYEYLKARRLRPKAV